MRGLPLIGLDPVMPLLAASYPQHVNDVQFVAWTVQSGIDSRFDKPLSLGWIRRAI